MNSNKFLTTLVLVALMSLPIFAQERKGLDEQMQSSILERNISKDIETSSISLRAFFTKILDSASIPGGIVLLSDESEYPVKFESLSLSLRDVLDSIVIAKPRYQWVLEDGVINLRPHENLPDLLEVRVSTFRVNNVTKGGALNALKETPEVKASIKAQGLNEWTLTICCGLSQPPSAPSPPQKRFSIDIKDVTVKEILNDIARKHSDTVWVYREWRDMPEIGKRYYRLILD